MKKRFLTMGLVLGMAVMAVGCSQDDSVKYEEVPATIEATKEVVETETEKETEVAEESSEEVFETFVTVGTYKSSNTAEDVNGEYEQATFTDENGNDFVANISEDTIIPEALVEGTVYEVEHSEVMTMSLPGIYPQVYSIKEVDETSETIAEDVVEAETLEEAETVEETASN